MESYWNGQPTQRYPELRGRRRADAAVIGGGLTGAHIALWLCRAGLKVALLEADVLGGGASALCAGMASVARGADVSRVERLMGAEAAAAFVASQSAALRSLRELAREPLMDSRWRDVNAYLMAEDARAVARLEREAAAMERAGLAARLTDAPQCPLPSRGALELPDQAVLDPATHLISVVEKARSLGLVVFERTRVVALENALALTPRGSVAAPYLIVATGFPILNAPGWYFPRLRQFEATLLPLRHAEPFDGMYWSLDGRYALRRAGADALFVQRGAPVGKSGPSPQERFDTRYAAYFPGASIRRCHTGCEPYSADGLPFIGPYSAKTPNLFVATGFGGSGLVGGVVAAQAISARILGLPESGYALYSGQRRSARSSAANASCAAGQLGRYLAGLTRWGAPRCPHMGCRLVYDRRTRLWACPCHGSRFDDIGRVLSAPAVRDATPRR